MANKFTIKYTATFIKQFDNISKYFILKALKNINQVEKEKIHIIEFM